MEVKNTEKYLEREFGIKSEEELEEAIMKVSDIDICLFVTPIFWEKQRSVAQLVLVEKA